MTTSRTTQTATDTAGHAAGPTPDPRPLFAKAMAIAAGVVAGVRPEQRHDPTPCTEFDVEQVFGHLVSVVERVAGMARGESPMSGGRQADTDGDWNELYAAAVARVEHDWADDAALARTITLPWMTGSGAEVLRSYLSELTVHTWDLAEGSGQKPAWDDEIVAIAFEASRNGLPAEGRAELFAQVREHMPPELRDAPDPFGPAIPVPETAPLIDRLVAWNGRRP